MSGIKTFFLTEVELNLLTFSLLEKLLRVFLKVNRSDANPSPEGTFVLMQFAKLYLQFLPFWVHFHRVAPVLPCISCKHS